MQKDLYMKKCLLYCLLTSFTVWPLTMINAAELAPKQPAECKVYFAAALFSLREKLFNRDVVQALEKKHLYNVFLPQRDGFEFYNLDKLLSTRLSPKETIKAEQLIIYYLDMGYFLNDSDLIVAILDEDLDPGVMAEISYGHLMGKYIIGVRTDVRSPYSSHPETGMHFFPLFQLDDYIFFTDFAQDSAEIDTAQEKIAHIINEKILLYNKNHVCAAAPINTINSNSTIQSLQAGAKILFDGMTPEDLHTDEGLKRVIDRYLSHREQLEKIFPKVYTGQVP